MGLMALPNNCPDNRLVDNSLSLLHASLHQSPPQGIQEAIHHFGPTIVNADNVAVSVETLALQHLAEDMSIIPTAADWLQHMEWPLLADQSDCRSPRHPPPNCRGQRQAFQHQSGGHVSPTRLVPQTATWFHDARHFAIRHSAFGIFEAERRFGIVLAQDGACPVPTRVAGEWHVRTVLGRIPAAADFLRRIKGQPWMAAAHKAHRRDLC